MGEYIRTVTTSKGNTVEIFEDFYMVYFANSELDDEVCQLCSEALKNGLDVELNTEQILNKYFEDAILKPYYNRLKKDFSDFEESHGSVEAIVNIRKTEKAK